MVGSEVGLLMDRVNPPDSIIYGIGPNGMDGFEFILVASDYYPIGSDPLLQTISFQERVV